MGNPDQSEPIVPVLGATRRKSVVITDDTLVTKSRLNGGGSLPMVITPSTGSLNLISWAAGHRKVIEENLISNGGILFRNWRLNGPHEFEEFMKAAVGDLLPYSNRSTPRTRVAGNVYTSTEYPADQAIPFHNENSYSAQWPMRISFYCQQAAETGGETPIADSRAIWKRISPGIRERFCREGVLYVRNYGYGLDLDWQEVFQTEDRDDVAKYCNTWGIEFEWKGGDCLTTRHRLPAEVRHPNTGDPLWFNQAHLFHVSSLPPETRETLLALPKEHLPRNAYYGNGEDIEQEVLDTIRDVYAAEAVAFPWQEGDVLLLDNMLVAHSRSPFTGSRKILTAMGISRTWDKETAAW